MSVKVHEPVCLDSPQDLYFWGDHFLGDQIKDEWGTIVAGAGGSATVIDAQTGGIVRLVAGPITNRAITLYWGNIRSLLVTKKATMELRAKLTQTNLVRTSFRLRFDGTNEIYFSYDSGVNANWLIVCEDAGTTSQDSGVAADTNHHIFRIECHTHGTSHVHFYIDGVETANSPITTNVPDDAGDYLQPWLFTQALEDVEKSTDVDYVVVRQDR